MLTSRKPEAGCVVLAIVDERQIGGNPMEDPTTEEREAWWQAFTQSVADWQLWEKYWATEAELNGFEAKKRHEFKHYLDFEYCRALAREKLADGETETLYDRAINEQRGRNQQFQNWLHELRGELATATEEFNHQRQRRWRMRIQIVVFAALTLVICFGLIRAYWQ
jgi:hypothetical protein